MKKKKDEDLMDIAVATSKAKWLINATNMVKVSSLVGISRHTLYKRLVAEDWKASEMLAINHYYDSYKKKVNGDGKEK